MGWRGTLRSIAAAQRRVERESVRRHREYVREQKFADKLAQLAAARDAVAAYENYVALLQSIHRDCGPPIDWAALRDAPEPRPLGLSHTAETRAKQALAAYEPSFIDRLLGRVERRRQDLENAVEAARADDASAYQNALGEHARRRTAWAESRELAGKVLAGDADAWQAAIESVAPFDELTQLGARVSWEIGPGTALQVSVHVNGDEIVPSESRSLLQSGKLSVKRLSQGQFNELYQDYVCGCGVRVAREAFALLPAETVFVTALADLLNSATGHVETVPIMSAVIPRQTLARLNVLATDASDSLRNFVHRMDFKKTRGFAAVARIDPAEISRTS